MKLDGAMTTQAWHIKLRFSRMMELTERAVLRRALFKKHIARQNGHDFTRVRGWEQWTPLPNLRIANNV